MAGPARGRSRPRPAGGAPPPGIHRSASRGSCTQHADLRRAPPVPLLAPESHGHVARIRLRVRRWPGDHSRDRDIPQGARPSFTGWLEQRLTPDGVELLLSEVEPLLSEPVAQRLLSARRPVAAPDGIARRGRGVAPHEATRGGGLAPGHGLPLPGLGEGPAPPTGAATAPSSRPPRLASSTRLWTVPGAKKRPRFGNHLSVRGRRSCLDRCDHPVRAGSPARWMGLLGLRLSRGGGGSALDGIDLGGRHRGRHDVGRQATAMSPQTPSPDVSTPRQLQRLSYRRVRADRSVRPTPREGVAR